jgi:hypothetical protein
MVDEYKIFNITGGAAAEYLGGAAKQKRVRKTAKASIKQEGGSAMPSAAPLVLEPLQQQYAPSLTATPTATAPTVPPTATAPTVPPTATAPTVPPTVPTLVGQNGGTKIIKVELKRKTAKKHVKLHPKKDGIKKLAMSKKARKVSIGLLSLHKRVRRAQKTQKKVKAMSLEDLKKELIAKKLIKATSKAPESVLRQIAADSRIMEKRAL